MKKTNKENPITTFRKANEARQKVVKASLKKAQDGIAVGAAKAAAKAKNESVEKIDYKSNNKASFIQNNPKGTAINTVTTRTPIDKKETTAKKELNQNTSPSKSVSYKAGVYSNSPTYRSANISNKQTKYGPITESQLKKSVDTTGYAAGKPTYDLEIKTKSALGVPSKTVTQTINRNQVKPMLNRWEQKARKAKTGGSTKYKTGGTTKATKFAALAPPYNKATAADRIVGAKKNAKKK